MNSSSTLSERWESLRKEQPGVRIRDAAHQLGVAEAELLATRCGAGVIRLAEPAPPDRWGRIIHRLPMLGRVMALTRNEHCVHERKGFYRDVGVFGTMGSVVGPDIDLRFFLNRWCFAFAVDEPSPHGVRESLQFFDADGTAVHKVYLQPESDREAFKALVADFRSADQTPLQSVQQPPPKQADRPDSEIDLDGFREGWRSLEDTHEFFSLLKKYHVGREQALRLIGPEFVEPLVSECGGHLLRAAAASSLPIMVFVGNPGMIQIHTGPVDRIAPHDGWINVLDPDFNLHLRESAVTSAWLVRKPTRDGVVTSVELFDAGGEMIVQFFGRRKPREPELDGWRALAASLPRGTKRA
jgi:putative hemin transport protein